MSTGHTAQTPAPYTDKGNRWTLRWVGGTTVHENVPLYLTPELNYAALEDDYSPAETSAREMFRLWVKYVHRQQEREREEKRLLWDNDEWWSDTDDSVTIAWFISSPREIGLFEIADRCPNIGHLGEFAARWTLPVQSATGDEIDWQRVPVFTGSWSDPRSGEHPYAAKGSYISEETGWTPAPYQATVSLRMLAARAGIEHVLKESVL